MFLFLNKHQVQEQVWGRSLGTFMHIHSRSPTTRAQHRTNQHSKKSRRIRASIGQWNLRFGWLALSSDHLHRDGLCTLPLILSLTYEFKWNLDQSWTLNSRYPLVLCFSMIGLHTFLFLGNHILGNPWLLSYWLVWYGLMEESLLSHLMCLEKFYQKEKPP